MIIIPYLRWNIDSWFERASRILCVVSVVWGTLIGVSFLIFPRQESEVSSDLKKTGSSLRLAYEAIGSGALALNPATQAAFLNLHQEIVVLAKNTRPDAPNARSGKILLGLKSSGEELVVTSGSAIYLDYDTSAGSAVFHFATEPTSLWMKPMIMDQSGVLIEAGRRVSGAEEEISRFSLPEPTIADLQNAASFTGKLKIRGIEELKQARLWGKDLLFERYGGGEFQELQGKMKIEFPGSSQVCYVASGDYLTFSADRWRVVPLKEVQVEAPLMHIKALSSQGAEIFAWDATGFYPCHLHLEMQYPPKLIPRPETLPTSLRIRTPSQITCLLGKRRLILKRGDWLLKTSTGWRNLKRTQDIEACLFSRLRGELFIFDSIEKEGAKEVLKGHLFDEMRTQVQPVTIPIEGEKSSTKKSKAAAKKLQHTQES